MKKTITCQTLAPWSRDPDAEDISSDVWIRYWNRREHVYCGPDILGYESLLGNIEVERDVLQKYPQHADANGSSEELRVFEQIKIDLDAGAEIAVWNRDNEKPGHGCPVIVCRAPMVTKAVAERALELYLRRCGVLKHGVAAKFRWMKNKSPLCVWSMN